MSYILDTKLQSQTIFLTSQKASTRNPFLFTLSNNITAPTNMRMLISVEDFVMSNCLTNITNYNNQIVFFQGVELIKVIPVGLYNVKSFITLLNTLLIVDTSIVATYDTAKFKIVFVATAPFQLLSSTTCSGLIGVAKNDKNEYIYPVVASAYPVAYTMTMNSCVDFSGTPYIFLKCEEIIASNINSYGVINNTLARIPINSPYGYKIYYRPSDSYKIITSIPTIQTLTFTLEDINNNNIDIGSNEFQLLLKISYIYEPQEKGDYLSGTLIHHMTTLPDEEVEQDPEDDFE